MANYKHGYTRNDAHHPLYKVWEGMIARCENPNNNSYQSYGGKGVRVCDRWRSSFADFLIDLGERPGPRYTLERIDHERHYEPYNVIWATYTEQNRNRPGFVKLSLAKAREIRALSVNGVSSRAIAEKFGVHRRSIQDVIKYKIWKE